MDKTKMKIAMMIGSMQEGGAEGQLLELIIGLHRRGHDVRLLLIHPRGALLQRAVDEGISIYGIGLPSLRPVLSPRGKYEAVRCLVRTVSYLRDFNPHVFHCFLFESEAWGWLAKVLGAPGRFVTSRLNLGYYKSESPWKQRVQNLYNRKSELIVANAKAVARDSLRREKSIHSGMIRVIYNGIDVARFQDAEPANLIAEFPQLADASHIVVSVANLFEYKGYFDLINAWKKVHQRFPQAHLICVGRDAEIGSQMREHITSAELQNVIHLLGARTDVPGILKACDAFVLASHEEGQPNSVIEASAAGLPVIATAVGGVPEVVEHKKSGFLVLPRRPDQLAMALISILSSTEKRKRFGEYGRTLIPERFGMKRYVDEYEEMYRDLITNSNQHD